MSILEGMGNCTNQTDFLQFHHIFFHPNQMSSAGAWVNIKNDQFGVVTTTELPCFLQIHGIVGFILGEHRDFHMICSENSSKYPARYGITIRPISSHGLKKPWGTYSRFGERHFGCPCYLGIQSHSVPSRVQVPHADHLGYWAMGLLDLSSHKFQSDTSLKGPARSHHFQKPKI